MKKKLILITFVLVSALMLNACGYTVVRKSELQTPAPATPTPVATLAPTPTVAPTPESTPTPTPTLTPGPTPVPAQVTVQPTPVSSPPKITKHPIAEVVTEGGSCMFITKYENAIWAEWHFVSPDGTRDLSYVSAQKEFPTLTIINGHTKDLKLENMPLALNGWNVYCRFSNNSGVAKTNTALITVLAKPAQTPQPTQPVATPEPQITDFEGRWAEEIAGRCQITFATRAPGSYNVDIIWSNSAFERSCWKMTGNSTANNTLTYTDGHYWLESYTSETDYLISDEVFSLSGTFMLQDGKMFWINNQTGQQTVFVRA